MLDVTPISVDGGFQNQSEAAHKLSQSHCDRLLKEVGVDCADCRGKLDYLDASTS